jgi:hypothetical protein
VLLVAVCKEILNEGSSCNARSDQVTSVCESRTASYKVEAGAEARYLKDSLDKMLGHPSYLDSSTLGITQSLEPGALWH